jgi:uncharacterized Zn-finger protein
MSIHDEQTVTPLRGQHEIDSTNFTPYELSLLVEVATASVNRLSSRLFSPILPSKLLSTYSYSNTQEYRDVESADTAVSLELAQLILNLRSQSYTPPIPPTSADDSEVTTPMADVHHNMQIVTKTFACDGCDKRFGSNKNLARHLKLHRNERKHVCTVCNRGFNRGDYLRKHASIHQGVKGVSIY